MGFWAEKSDLVGIKSSLRPCGVKKMYFWRGLRLGKS